MIVHILDDGGAFACKRSTPRTDTSANASATPHRSLITNPGHVPTPQAPRTTMVRCFMFRAPIAGDAAGVGSVIIPCRPQGCTRGRCCAELHHSVVRLARMRWLTAYVAETEESWRERGKRKVGTAVREVARQCVMASSSAGGLTRVDGLSKSSRNFEAPHQASSLAHARSTSRRTLRSVPAAVLSAVSGLASGRDTLSTTLRVALAATCWVGRGDGHHRHSNRAATSRAVRAVRRC